jgi:hypothetical protein
MTIWPGPRETYWDWVVGFPLELRPFAWDYLRIRCDGDRVEIEPHYLESTWDTFWTNNSGAVTAQAMGGLFPYTLGDQVDLLEGIVATLAVLPPLVVGDSPDDAAKIQQIHDILTMQTMLTGVGAVPIEGMSFLRRSASDFIWRRKLKRLTRNRIDKEPRKR